MKAERFFDQTHLRGEAYADGTRLAARKDIYRYQTPKMGFTEWALSFLPQSCGDVLDVGCGYGTYLVVLSSTRRVRRLVGMDLSEGMLAEIPKDLGATLFLADAQALPFVSGSFDTLLCMHVLYHVPDISRAIADMRRVLRPGRVAMIATNGSDHQRELREGFDRAVKELSGMPGPYLASPRRFRLEDGEELLRKHFDNVVREDLRSELIVPEPDPVVSYLESIRSFHEDGLPPSVGWNEAVDAFRKIVEEQIAKNGAFTTTTHAGIFLCR